MNIDDYKDYESLKQEYYILLQEIETLNYDNFYFPNQSKESIPLISCTIIGWSKYSFEYKDRLSPWCCNFRDLTNEGRRLFYAIKKLHNEKEIRILTFNNIILK